jgi:hypothetical protein
MINSTNLVPDIQYWFEKFVKNSIMNKNLSPFPSTISSTYLLENKSFIRLLFDDAWPNTITDYSYMFEQLTNTLSIPNDFRTRLMVYPITGKYYQISDSTSVVLYNIFNLQPDDFTLLDKLLEYRLDSTSVITISDITYDDLTTVLSQLIYLYLDLKINENYTNFDNVTPLSGSTTLLDNCYEMYVCEELFNFISSKGI